MSYNCEISFKNVEPAKVYTFLVNFKKNVAKHLEDIAKENVWYSPLLKQDFEFEWAKESYSMMDVCLRDKVDTWASKVFQYRYFYIAEQNLLGIFGVPDSVKDMFDNTSFFQNSTDQDYDYDDWNGIKWFEEIANKWKNLPLSELISTYTGIYGDENNWNHMSNEDYLSDEKNQDYYRKSLCYKEIWSHVGYFLDCDDDVVYLSLFGHYDFYPMRRFSIALYEAGKEEIRKEHLLPEEEIYLDEERHE